MSKNYNLEDYKKAIKVKFEIEKSAKNADFCLNPTPANFKKWCLLLFESKLESVDLEIFNKFFGLTGNEDKYQKIKNFDIDKFRPFQNFLIKNTEISQLESLNLIAVLLDFKPRPFSKFRTKDFVNQSVDLEEKQIIQKNHSTERDSKSIVDKKMTENKKFKFIFFSVLVILVVSLIVKNSFFNKNCMIWNQNHYEPIDCNDLKQGLFSIKPIPINEDYISSFKKIEVNKSTLFFNQNKPCVWYGKSLEGEYEYFSSFGLHPETGKTLKPISKYIINKYVYQE